jgi:hypothetical protein
MAGRFYRRAPNPRSTSEGDPVPSFKNIAIMAVVAGAVYFGIEHYKTVKGK